MSKKEYQTEIWKPVVWDYWIWISEKGELPESGPWCIATNLDDFKFLLDKYGHAAKYSFGEGALKADCLVAIKERFEGKAASYESH